LKDKKNDIWIVQFENDKVGNFMGAKVYGSTRKKPPKNYRFIEWAIQWALG